MHRVDGCGGGWAHAARCCGVVHDGRYYYNEECFLRGDAPVKGNRLVMAEYGVVSNTADESMFRLVNLKVSPAV